MAKAAFLYMSLLWLALLGGRGSASSGTARHGATSPQQAQQEPTEDYAARFNRGQELLKQFRLYDAIAEFREAVRINPNHIPSHGGLLIAYSIAENFPLAWREVRFMRQAGAQPPEQLLGALTEAMPEAEATKQLEGIEKELADAQKAASDQPRSATARVRLAESLDKTGAYKEAIRECEGALLLDFGEPKAHLLLGRLYARDRQNPEQAILHLRNFLQKVQRTPEHSKSLVQAYSILGDIYLRTGREQEAVATYDEGLQVGSSEAHLLNNAAWLYATAQETSLRNPQKALQYARKAVEVSEGKNASYLDTLAEAYYLNGDFAEAVRVEKKAISLRPSDEFLKRQLEKFEKALENQRARP